MKNNIYVRVEQTDFADIGRDFLDYEIYDCFPDVIITGNDDFIGYNTDNNLYSNVYDAINSYGFYDQLEDISLYDNDIYHTYKECVEDYLNIKVSATQARLIKNRLLDKHSYRTRYYSDDDILIADIMSIVTGHEYEWSTIYGYCQGDWQEVLYPADKYNAHDLLDELEGYYFTGRDHCITIYEDDEEIDCFWGFYWQDNDTIKELVAEQCGCNVDDVHLFYISGYSTIPCYTEVA